MLNTTPKYFLGDRPTEGKHAETRLDNRQSDPKPAEHEAGILTTQLRRTVPLGMRTYFNTQKVQIILKRKKCNLKTGSAILALSVSSVISLLSEFSA
jgi:hypothetical protein